MIAEPPEPIADFKCCCNQRVLRPGRGIEFAEQQAFAKAERRHDHLAWLEHVDQCVEDDCCRGQRTESVGVEPASLFQFRRGRRGDDLLQRSDPLDSQFVPVNNWQRMVDLVQVEPRQRAE